MRKGYAIVNQYRLYSGISNFYLRLKEELGNLGIELLLSRTGDAGLFLNDKGQVEGRLSPSDFVVFLDKDRYAAYGLEAMGFRLFNRARSIELCDDKMATYLALANKGIPMPLTITPPLDYVEKENDESGNTSDIEDYEAKDYGSCDTSFVQKTPKIGYSGNHSKHCDDHKASCSCIHCEKEGIKRHRKRHMTSIKRAAVIGTVRLSSPDGVRRSAAAAANATIRQ